MRQNCIHGLTLAAVVVANLLNDVTHQHLVVHRGVAGDLAAKHDHTRFRNSFCS